MKAKRLTALVFALLLMTTLWGGAPAWALSEGAYTAPCNTYYINQDTGVTDDGGTKNAALGEGMCRSTIYKDALIEIEGDDIYVTIRMNLMSNIKDIKFSVQKTVKDPDSYKSVSYSTMQEDSAADTADMRFKVPRADAYIRCDMYVIPMGRDVVYYMNADSASAVQGSGDFVVSVALPAPEPAAEGGGAPEAEAEGDKEQAGEKKPGEDNDRDTIVAASTAGQEPAVGEKPAAGSPDSSLSGEGTAGGLAGEPDAQSAVNEPAEIKDAEKPEDSGALALHPASDGDDPAAGNEGEPISGAETQEEPETEEPQEPKGGVGAEMLLGAAAVVAVGAFIVVRKKGK